MNRKELTVAAVALALIAAAALFLGARKNVLGKPGLVLESQSLTNELGEIVRKQRVAIPANVPTYKDELLPISTNEVKVLPKDTDFGRRMYSGDGSYFQVSAVLMGTDRTSIHKPYYCVTGQGWHIDKSEVVEVPMARPMPYKLKTQLLTTTGKRRLEDGREIVLSGLYMYWYVSESQLTPDHNEQMWWLARDLLTKGVLERWAYVSIFSQCPPGQEQVLLQKMKRLAGEVVPAFQIPPGNGAPQKETAFLTGEKTLKNKETF